MTFSSILFSKDAFQDEATEQPVFFPDLNMDQVIDAITASRQEYNLKPFFYASLRDIETIRYRQEVMRDLEDKTVMTHIKAFAERMKTVRRYMAMVEKLDFDSHRKGWIPEAVLIYCDAVTTLALDLGCVDLKSRGLLTFREYVTNYVHSQEFQSLATDAKQVKKTLSEVKYCVIIQSNKFKVKRYEGEIDYSIDVEKTFEKFKQGTVKDYMVKLPDRTGMNHIEAKILEFVTSLYPEPFAALDRFCTDHNRFPDETIQSFDREIQFYIAYLDFISDLKRSGLPFCYPTLNPTNREGYVYDGFDLALAHVLRHSEKSIVLNDFLLKDPERIIVVTGPNQGGKTTFARMFGQLHYLSSLGCPVPGSKARLFLFDQIFTHFEMEEDIRNLRGKFEDDLIRIHDIITRTTPDSILIVNEIFASTTLQDAVFLSKEIMARVMELDALCVWVTFIDELSSMNEKTVSMVATVVPEDPGIRIFKIIRKPADGLAYALSLAQKHRLTNEEIKERIK
ncbi:MAG: DNA mismatch repair protein MutS [bacterium]|nr:MAG: DNA mismatch repair protein MutS [bacterium]